jgi:hypothetical protein
MFTYSWRTNRIAVTKLYQAESGTYGDNTRLDYPRIADHPPLCVAGVNCKATLVLFSERIY